MIQYEYMRRIVRNPAAYGSHLHRLSDMTILLPSEQPTVDKACLGYHPRIS